MRSRAILVVLVGAMILGGCASSRKPEPDGLSITGGDGNLNITLSSDTARSLLEQTLGSTLECDGDLDADVEQMLRTLDRRGRRARHTMRGEDSTIFARRRGGNLRLEVRSSGGGAELDVTMPWAVAECLLGQSTSLERALGSGSIRVALRGNGGGSFTFEVE